MSDGASRITAQSRVLVRLLLLCSISILSVGCTVSRFVMQKDSLFPVRAVVLTHPSTVERTHTNAFSMMGPARVAMRTERITHGRFSTELIRYSASPLIIQLRTTPHDDSVFQSRGVVVTIQGDSTVVESSEFRAVNHTPLPIGKPFVLEVRNYGHALHLSIGHTDLGMIHSTLPCTEWVIASVPETSRVDVGDPWFDISH